MFGTAFMAILAIVGWLAFATAAHPGHWQGRDRDGVIAIIGAAMGLIFTPIVAQLLIHGVLTVICVITLSVIYIGYYCLLAHFGRTAESLKAARVDPAV